MTLRNPGACFTDGAGCWSLDVVVVASADALSVVVVVGLNANKSTIGPVILGTAPLAFLFSAASSNCFKSNEYPSSPPPSSSSSSSSSAENRPAWRDRAAEVCVRVVSVVFARNEDAEVLERAAAAEEGRFFAEGEKATGRGFGVGFVAGSGKVEGSGLLGLRSVDERG